MIRYFLRRASQSFLVVVMISIVVFVLSRLTPGDPALLKLGQEGLSNPGALEAEREALGLNSPLPVQYVRWLSGILHGDLGNSLLGGQPVASLLGAAAPATIELVITTIVLSGVSGLVLGIFAASKPGGIVDRVVGGVSSLGIATPNYWVALLLILLFAVLLRVLPASGYVPLWVDPGTNLIGIVLPTLVLSFRETAVFALFVRQDMVRVLRSQYVLYAVAKGLSRRDVVIKHVARNGAIPLVTVIGIEVGVLLGGVVVIEQIFSWTGLGWLSLQSVLNRDYNVIQITVLFVAVSYAIMNLLTDLVYVSLNPEIREAYATSRSVVRR